MELKRFQVLLRLKSKWFSYCWHQFRIQRKKNITKSFPHLVFILFLLIWAWKSRANFTSTLAVALFGQITSVSKYHHLMDIFTEKLVWTTWCCERCSCLWRRDGMGWHLRSLPAQTILWFHGYKQLVFSLTVVRNSNCAECCLVIDFCSYFALFSCQQASLALKEGPIDSWILGLLLTSKPSPDQPSYS